MVYLRDSAKPLSYYVTILFEKIYKEGKIPAQWKVGKITPIPKKGNSKEVQNYRPITSLCSLAKVFERCLLNRINELGDFTGSNQYGFKKKHSTCTALLHLQHEIATSLDEGLYHGIVSLDLSAAFDMVNPKLLTERMKLSGLPNDVINLIGDWLTDRQAYVEVGGETSYIFEVPEGTVQGSVLGPLLFAIFIAPMFELENVASFADDSYLGARSDNLVELMAKISRSSTNLTHWFKSSGLVVNETKTEFCVFHKNKKSKCHIDVNGTRVENKSALKALGIYLDENLNFERHVQYISNSCQKINMGFNILKKHFNLNELLHLVTSLYFSKMYYASEVWLSHNLTVKLQKTLLSVSARVLKTISGIRCDQNDRISFIELHKQFNRATPVMMTSYVQATCLHRVLNSEVPQNIFMDLLVNHVDARRHYKPTFIKSNKSRVGENILRNRIQKMTNKLSMDITTLTYNQLKIQAKKDFLSYL